MYLICREVPLPADAIRVTGCHTKHAHGYILVVLRFREDNAMEEGRRNYVFGKKEVLICQPFEYVCCSGKSVYVSENSVYYIGLQCTLRFRPRSIASWTECAKPCFESAI